MSFFDNYSLIQAQNLEFSNLDLLAFMNDRQKDFTESLPFFSTKVAIEHHPKVNQTHSYSQPINRNQNQIPEVSQGDQIFNQHIYNALTQQQQYIKNRQRQPEFRMIIRPQTQDTKNLIQFFRRPIKTLLTKQVPEKDLQNEQAYTSFSGSVSQYKLKQLLLVPKFRRYFKRYFAKNQIYRDLLTAGIKLESKKKFVKKLEFFKDTFDKVTFNTIQVHQM